MKTRFLLSIFLIMLAVISTSLAYRPAYAYFDRLSSSAQETLTIGEWGIVNNLRKIIFGQESLNDYQRTGNWTEDENGFQSNFGLLFIPNDYTSYRVTLVAQLDYLGDEATYGGFGLLFETSLDGNQDTGFALQFDRGLLGVAIRPRINGGEQGTIALVRNADNPVIPISRRDDFWVQEQKIILEVFQASETKKLINVFLDEVLILENFIIDSSLEESYLGLRAWGRPTEFRSLLVEELNSPIESFDPNRVYQKGEIVLFEDQLWLRDSDASNTIPPGTNRPNRNFWKPLD